MHHQPTPHENAPPPAAGAAPHAARLFMRGEESVRITRVTNVAGLTMLFVYGPGGDTGIYECPNEAACLEKQREVERDLMTQGFVSLPVSERRTAAERRRASRGDRRRATLTASRSAATS